MLITSTFFFLTTFLFLMFTLSYLSLFFKKNLFIFTKIWIVFIFFLLLNLILANFGEDFFTIFALAAELPVFFGFFFFFIVKSQLSQTQEKLNFKKIKWSLFFIFLLLCSINTFYTKPYIPHLYNFYFSINIPQKSDFFIYYLTYFFLNPQLVVCVGFLISTVTVLLIVLTFIYQTKNVEANGIKQNINWVKTQNINKQATHKASVLFFKI